MIAAIDKLLEKLNYKCQNDLICINAPDGFKNYMMKVLDSKLILQEHYDSRTIDFMMIFVTEQASIKTYADLYLPYITGDAIVWFCYPKKSSKKFNSNISRDRGWEVLGDFGMEGVRMVAIDDDWSALRFRKVEFIKKLNRKFKMLSKEGEKKKMQAKVASNDTTRHS